MDGRQLKKMIFIEAYTFALLSAAAAALPQLVKKVLPDFFDCAFPVKHFAWD